MRLARPLRIRPSFAAAAILWAKDAGSLRALSLIMVQAPRPGRRRDLRAIRTLLAPMVAHEKAAGEDRRECLQSPPMVAKSSPPARPGPKGCRLGDSLTVEQP